MPNFEELDARIASALNKIIDNSHFKRRVSLEEQKAPKKDRFLRGRQIAYLIYEYFRVSGANDSVENCADQFTNAFRNDDLQEFDSKWDEILLSMTQIPSDDILESLYKLRIRASEKLKTVLQLYDLERHKKKLGPEYHKMKTMVKRSIEQDVDKRAKMTQQNPSPSSFMQQNERNASRTRSPRGKSPNGRKFRWPCKDYLKGTCTVAPSKTKSGCRFGEKCSYAHRQVDEQPNKRSRKNGYESAVAMLKSTRQLGYVFQVWNRRSLQFVQFTRAVVRHANIRDQKAMFYLGQSYLSQFLLRPILLRPSSTWANSTQARFYLGT